MSFQIDLPGVPVMMVASGLYEVEFRLLVACRDGKVYQVKRWAAPQTLRCMNHVKSNHANGRRDFLFRGDKTASRGFDLHAQPIGIGRIGKNVVVGCTDDTLKCFALKVLEF